MNRDLHETSLIILAAGSSTRFGDYKQVTPVGPYNEMIWEYGIFDALSLGVKTIVIVTSQDLREKFSKIIKKKLPSEIEVHFAIQDIPKELREDRSKPLGTGQALLCSLPFIRKTSIMINGDDFYGSMAFKNAANHLSKEANQNLPCVLSYPIESTLSSIGNVSRACLKIEDDLVMDMEEFSDVSIKGNKILGMGNDSGMKEMEEGTPVSMNLWMIDRELIKEIEKDYLIFLQDMEHPTSGEYQLPDAIRKACMKMERDIFSLPAQSSYCGLTHPADLYPVQKFIAARHESGDYPSPLWK
jgi:Nucleotidyl transferase